MNRGATLGFTSWGLIFPIDTDEVQAADGTWIGLREFSEERPGITYTLTRKALDGALGRLTDLGLDFCVWPRRRGHDVPDIERRTVPALCGRYSVTIRGASLLGLRGEMRLLGGRTLKNACMETDAVDVEVADVRASVAAGCSFAGGRESLFLEPSIVFLTEGGRLLEKLVLGPLEGRRA